MLEVVGQFAFFRGAAVPAAAHDSGKALEVFDIGFELSSAAGEGTRAPAKIESQAVSEFQMVGAPLRRRTAVRQHRHHQITAAGGLPLDTGAFEDYKQRQAFDQIA